MVVFTYFQGVFGGEPGVFFEGVQEFLFFVDGHQLNISVNRLIGKVVLHLKEIGVVDYALEEIELKSLIILQGVNQFLLAFGGCHGSRP